uniref:NADH-ubiquinone oxidoreductase chain 6 n=1 Tax=Tomicodon cryptus TaxID=2912956 RepID=A0AA51X2H5_9TELE|nr:NADH dehydrogenase subunit 6 [Tomicodon cryptus]WMY90472.1 NADH dehydrogenase subunit 6 [Tomicodon cryptus]
MVYLMFILLGGMVVGMAAVAANPSPYYAALGLVLVSGLGCGVLVGHGGSFLSLILFLIYLGGMLVVFAYSAALAAEPYPESWGSTPVLSLMGAYMMGVLGAVFLVWEGWHFSSWGSVEELGELGVVRGDSGGVAFLYLGGGEMLIVAGGFLLLTLFVVLELTRGLSRGVLRAV